MNIPITEKYVLTSDKYNWIIGKPVKRVDKDGNEREEVRGIRFYSSLDALMTNELNILVREGNHKSIAELRSSVSHALQQLKQAVQSIKLEIEELKLPLH